MADRVIAISNLRQVPPTTLASINLWIELWAAWNDSETRPPSTEALELLRRTIYMEHTTNGSGDLRSSSIEWSKRIRFASSHTTDANFRRGIWEGLWKWAEEQGFSYRELCKRAGKPVPGISSYTYTEEEMLQAWSTLRAGLGRSPTAREIDAAAETPSANTYLKRFGSLREIENRLGIRADGRGLGRPTRERLILDYKNYTLKLGRLPTREDINSNPDMFSWSTYVNYLGTKTDVVAAAGLKSYIAKGKNPRTLTKRGQKSLEGKALRLQVGALAERAKLGALTIDDFASELRGLSILAATVFENMRGRSAAGRQAPSALARRFDVHMTNITRWETRLESICNVCRWPIRPRPKKGESSSRKEAKAPKRSKGFSEATATGRKRAKTFRELADRAKRRGWNFKRFIGRLRSRDPVLADICARALRVDSEPYVTDQQLAKIAELHPKRYSFWRERFRRLAKERGWQREDSRVSSSAANVGFVTVGALLAPIDAFMWGGRQVAGLSWRAIGPVWQKIISGAKLILPSKSEIAFHQMIARQRGILALERLRNTRISPTTPQSIVARSLESARPSESFRSLERIRENMRRIRDIATRVR